MTLEDVIEQCGKDSYNWFPAKSQDLFFMAACVAGESGELINEVKKVERGTHTMESQFVKIEEEAIDAFIYLCNVFRLLGTDVVKEYNAKRARNAERFGRTDQGS